MPHPRHQLQPVHRRAERRRHRGGPQDPRRPRGSRPRVVRCARRLREGRTGLSTNHLSASNPRVQTLRRLIGRRSARSEAGLFVVQGRVLVEDAVAAGIDVREVYLRDGESVPAGVRVVPHVLDARTFDSVNDTVTPQGVIAVCAVPGRGTLSTGAGAWYVVAHGLSDPGNLGTVIRSAEAAGASGIVVTPGTVDVWSPKTVRSAAGGLFRVPVHQVESLGDLRSAGVRLVGTTSHGDAPSMYGFDFSGCIAVVLGNEAHGLGHDEPVDGWVRIPHAGRAESLNVAMAASVLALHVAHVRGGH